MKWVTGRFGLIPVRTPGCFSPIPFRSGCCGLILEVGVFVPILVGRFGLLYFIQIFQVIKVFLASPIDFM